jgi:hypothetical protein
MSAEQRRRSAPNSDAAATSAAAASAIGEGAAVRGGGEMATGAGSGKWAGLGWALSLSLFLVFCLSGPLSIHDSSFQMKFMDPLGALHEQPPELFWHERYQRVACVD